jgi:sugar transferase (PEP-CTERM/EpsH1 system associated)
VTGSRPTLLYVVHRVPYPPDKGDRIRAYNLLRHLSARADIHLACLADEQVPDATLAALDRLCSRVAVVPLGRRSRWLWALRSLASGGCLSEGAFYVPRLVGVLRNWARDTDYHAALASASSVAPYLRVGTLAAVPAVVDVVDVDSQKWLDYAAAGAGPRAWVHRLEGHRLRRRERALAGWARAVTVVSEHEARLYGGFVPPDKVHAVPNGVDAEYFVPQDPGEGGCGCVFVGALDYRPNVDAACWFARQVWPQIHERHPSARLRLVGRKPVGEVRALGSVPGVDVVGQVPDVRPHVAGAAVAVAPLRIARGVQNKVLEAMAMGRVVVASPAALAGLAQHPDLPAVRAETTDEWVRCVGELLDDASRRLRLGVAGRQYVLRHHDWGRCLAPFADLLGLGRPGGTHEAGIRGGTSVRGGRCQGSAAP